MGARGSLKRRQMKKAAEAASFAAIAGRLRSGLLGLGLLAGVLLAELLDPAGGVDDLLLARVERVARRADFHVQRLAERRARREGVAAAAGDLDFLVFGMDLGFHGRSLRLAWSRAGRSRRCKPWKTIDFRKNGPKKQ